MKIHATNTNFPSLLQTFMVSKTLIELFLNLKMYKIEKDRLKKRIENQKEYKKVFQIGFLLITFYVLFYDFSFTNILILILSLLDDFIELNKKKKLSISFLIVFIKSHKEYQNLFVYNKSFTENLLTKENKSIIKNSLIYFYLIMKRVFLLNSINILSGINGIETFQLIYFSLFYQKYKLTSYLIPIFLYNKYPAKIFIGNGLLIYVSSEFINFKDKINIQLEISEWICWIPQLFNALLTIFQISFLKCPRHRMPEIDYKNLLESTIRYSTYKNKGTKRINLTILNFIIKYFGIKTEYNLFYVFVFIQIIFFVISFTYSIFKYPNYLAVQYQKSINP